MLDALLKNALDGTGCAAVAAERKGERLEKVRKDSEVDAKQLCITHKNKLHIEFFGGEKVVENDFLPTVGRFISRGFFFRKKERKKEKIINFAAATKIAADPFSCLLSAP